MHQDPFWIRCVLSIEVNRETYPHTNHMSQIQFTCKPYNSYDISEALLFMESVENYSILYT